MRMLISLLCACGVIAAPQSQATSLIDPVLALVDVTVVDVSGPAPLVPHQTVIIRGGRIAAIGHSATEPVPKGAQIIARGASRFVMAGLTDMHTHIFDEGEFQMYLDNGVTTVRNMHGTPTHLAWRAKIAAGFMEAPTLVTAGPIIDGDPPMRSTNIVVRTEEEARRIVDEQAAAGYDFIKIYDNVPLRLYRAIVERASALHVKVAGHLPTPVGLDGLFSGVHQDSIEHAEELLPFFNDGRTSEGVDALAQRLAKERIWVDPTIDVYASARDQAHDWPALQRKPEMLLVNPKTKTTWGWEPTALSRYQQPREIARYDRTLAFFTDVLVPALQRAGVRLLTGSDAPIATLVPGYSLVDELMLLHASGLSTRDVLRASTVNAAEFLGRSADVGTVTGGKVADLLVLDANPLDDLNALRHNTGVVFRGRWRQKQ